LQREADLAQVAPAPGGLSGCLGAEQTGQEQGREDREDGDDDEKFDEGESAWFLAPHLNFATDH
jgi:hypothetical protein